MCPNRRFLIWYREWTDYKQVTLSLSVKVIIAMPVLWRAVTIFFPVVAGCYDFFKKDISRPSWRLAIYHSSVMLYGGGEDKKSHNKIQFTKTEFMGTNFSAKV